MQVQRYVFLQHTRPDIEISWILDWCGFLPCCVILELRILCLAPAASEFLDVSNGPVWGVYIYRYVEALLDFRLSRSVTGIRRWLENSLAERII